MAQSVIDPQLGGQQTHFAAIEPIAPIDFVGLLRVVWRGKWIVALTMTILMATAGFYAFRIAQPTYQATASITPIALEEMESLSTTELNIAAELDAVTSRAVLLRVIGALNLHNDPEFNRYLNATSPFQFASMRRELRHLLAGTQEQVPTDADVREKTVENLASAVTIQLVGDTETFQISVKSGSAIKAVMLTNILAEEYRAQRQLAWSEQHQTTAQWLSEKADALKTQLEQQENEIAALIADAQLQHNSGFDDLSREVLAAEQSLASIQANIAEITSHETGQNARSVAAVEQLQIRHQTEELELNRLRAQLGAQSAGLALLHQRELEAAATRTVYADYLTRLEQTRAQSARETTVFAHIAPAMRGHYLGPQKVLILTIAGVAGMLLGLVLVALRKSLQKGVYDASDLRQCTGLPVFAQLSRQQTRSPRQTRRALKHPPTQQIRDLCTSLSVANEGIIPKVILSTSSTSDEGKGPTALMLSQALCSDARSVLFISADEAIKQCFSDESISQLFRADVEFLWSHDDLSSTFAADTVAQAISDGYDHVIIDAPPATLTPQTAVWALHADTALYSVRRASTSKEIINRGLRALQDTGVPIAGLLLTDASQTQSGTQNAGAFIPPAAQPFA